MVKKRLRIIWDNEAKKSLRNIYDYLKGRESIDIARKVRNEISSQAIALIDFPENLNGSTNWNLNQETIATK